jgi:outer membrane protein TolC
MCSAPSTTTSRSCSRRRRRRRRRRPTCSRRAGPSTRAFGSAADFKVLPERQLVATTSLLQPTALWGIDLAVGHQLGTGSFKPYEEGDKTGDAGELTFDLAVPLLAGGFTDSDRTALAVGMARGREADARLEQRRVESARTARELYWRWTAAGERLYIADDAVAVAERVLAGTRERVARGDLAPIEALDAERVLVERRLRQVEARRDLTAASLRLGLYLRDPQGRPAPPAEVPDRLQPPTAPATTAEQALRDALERRPELAALDARRAAAEARVRLAQVNLMPKLDLKLGLDQPLSSGDKTELKVGGVLDVALLQRGSRGRLDRALAERRVVELDQSFLLDRLDAEVRAAWTVLQAAQERVGLAAEQVRLAAELEAAVRAAFDLGDRTLFDVYLREQATLAARGLWVDAVTDRQIAEAELLAVTGGR